MNEKQNARLLAWISALKLVYGEKFYNGNFTYSFTPNGIGSELVVRHNPTGHEIDITDMDSW